MKRRHLAGTIGLILWAICLCAAPALGADFPSKPVTLYCTYAAGGTADIVMRTLAEATSKYLGQPVVVENKAGGAGTLGAAQMAANAAPDGYTVSQISVNIFRNPHLMPVTWDPLKDFTYIINLSGYTFGVIVKADAPWKTWDEFVAYAKANPMKIKYNSPGTYSTLHIVMEVLAKQRDIKWIHVPTKGGGEETPMLLGGHVDASTNSSGGWLPQVESKQARLLCTWGDKRMKRFPDVPTLKDLGYNLVESSSFGVAGPKGMDPKVVKVLHEAFKKGMHDPLFLNVLDKFDMPLLYQTSEEYTEAAKSLFVNEKKKLEQIGFKKPQ